MNSLAARVGWSALAVLLAFVVFTGWALERAFADSSRAALRERLLAQIYLIMAASEVTADGRVQLSQSLGELRLNQPDSGLYARVGTPAGATLWQSPSALARVLPPPTGELAEQFGRMALAEESYWYASLRINWETDSDTIPLIYSVYERAVSYDEQMTRYRRTLWGWLAGMAMLLLFTLAVALAWGLRPLRTVAAELQAIEEGRQQTLHNVYPREIRRLSDNLNALLHHERARQMRYQHALGDLAHSLKTPLAILRGINAGTQMPLLEEQVLRMDQIVQYQLQRAGAGGHAALSSPLDVVPVARRLLEAMRKVYAGKQIAVELQLQEAVRFYGSEGDLMELLGNLLDNAFKWCSHRVRVTIVAQGERLLINVDDDGPGIAAAAAAQVFERGRRLDESVPGHGLGLAMAQDIVSAYEGELHIGRSAWGGAQLRVVLPGTRGARES